MRALKTECARLSLASALVPGALPAPLARVGACGAAVARQARVGPREATRHKAAPSAGPPPTQVMFLVLDFLQECTRAARAALGQLVRSPAFRDTGASELLGHADLEVTEPMVPGRCMLLAVATSHMIRRLAISDVLVSPAAAEALARALPCSRVRELSLVSTQLCDLGARSLAAAIEAHGALEDVVLVDQEAITWRGAAAVALAVGRQGAVRRLRIACSPLGDLGARAVADALCESRGRREPLAQLDLHGCAVSEEGAEAIASAILCGLPVRALNLTSNNLGPDACLRLQVAWAMAGHNLAALELGLWPGGAPALGGARAPAPTSESFLCTSAQAEASGGHGEGSGAPPPMARSGSDALSESSTLAGKVARAQPGVPASVDRGSSGASGPGGLPDALESGPAPGILLGVEAHSACRWQAAGPAGP